MASNISISDVIVDELAGFAAFVIRLDVASTQTVSVNYATANGTASGGGTSGYDYIATSGTIQFAPGELTKTVQVQINDDSYWEEPFHQFTMNLSGAVNATIYDGVATGTIYDNDAPVGTPNAKVSDIVVDETTGTATFVITLDRPSDSTVSIDFATQDGSAKAGSDYVAQSGTLSFAAGEAVKTVSVALTNDTVAEGDETFGLALSGFVNAATLTPRATATIAANDATAVTSPQISIADVIVDEASGYANFVVRLSAPGTQTVSVNYATANGTASGGGSSGYDYIATSGVLKFAPGQTVQVIQVPINDDDSTRGTIDFKLNLSGAVNATIADSQAIGTIFDDEGPLITSNEGKGFATATVAENSTAVTAVTATNPAGGALAYSIVGGDDLGLFNIDVATGVLSFKAAPDFEAPGDVGSNNVYNLTVRVSDGTLGSYQLLAVSITNVNEAPRFTTGASLSAPENGTAIATIAATDPDAGAKLTYSITGGADAALLQINANTGALSFKAAPNFEAPGDAGANRVYDVTIKVSDGALTASKAFAITLTNVNEAPTITSNGGGVNAAVSIAENSRAVTTVTATDPDAGATRTFSITGGADAALFQIDSATGALSFKAAPNFEARGDAGANNVYDVIVQVSDGVLTDSQAIAVTVTNANDAPRITSNGGGVTAAVAVAESGSAVTKVVAVDDDAGATVTYSITGGADAALFRISSTGALAFISRPNFERPLDAGGNNIYDVVVTASDGVLTDSQALAVTVTNVNEAPVIRSNGAGANASIALAENTLAVTRVIGRDPDAGATLTYSIVGGADAAAFSINATRGTLSLLKAANFEAPADVGNDNTYDVIVQVSDGTLVDQQTLHITVQDVLNEVITGTRQADTLSGAGGDDTIFGLAGGDILNGSTGDDILYGGTGRDSLTGGLGADTFVFDSVLNATSNRDTIVDFVASEGDTIQLSRSIFQAFTANGALSASQFVAGAGITEGNDANDIIIYNTTSGVLSYDADGVGGNAAVAFALLGTGAHPALTAADFLIVA
ncbi:Calx-beta domain-containing protein [Novosphingobium cyanobacteriorum]|uniref:Calx-beta domain-containing protein n=1 Tax=Novosphingobium cyanobacteriorum TaxID=3024215 RepID=A0ABT6CI61_9SPHN|nr:Calx-beta domain-containing protein [Novosphingobium cyanobacteriorum]MDF8333605.1 Calx-beta domain-containing protein [Novosphingobium cyanobacteriorum]